MWLIEIKKYVKSLFNLALPAFCYGCNEPLNETEIIVCFECYSKMPKINTKHIEQFQKRIEKKYYDNINIIFEYNKLFKDLMQLYKYQEFVKLAYIFGKSVSIEINKIYDVITYVPLHEDKERERGFNQSQIIAEIVAKEIKANLGNNLLQRRIDTKTQTKLTRNERIKNIEDAFYVKEDIKNKSVLIIDDVVTTGATLNECSKVLRSAGCRLVDIVAMATPTKILE